MELRYFMDEIKLPINGKRCVLNFEMQLGEYKMWKSLFYRNTEEFLQKSKSVKEKEKLILYLYTRFAVDLYEEYRVHNISKKIYFDTFSDFTVWYNHCLKEKKKPGLSETAWLAHHLKMELFRLGRLQYEKGENILHVHIPEGMPLNSELCDFSFAMANDFFSEEYKTYDCLSWLLDPALKHILAKDSNIIKFQNRFEILNVTESRQAEERVFGGDRIEREKYPENTDLQKKMKKYLLGGNKLGEGYGIISRHIKNGAPIYHE